MFILMVKISVNFTLNALILTQIPEEPNKRVLLQNKKLKQLILFL